MIKFLLAKQTSICFSAVFPPIWINKCFYHESSKIEIFPKMAKVLSFDLPFWRQTKKLKFHWRNSHGSQFRHKSNFWVKSLCQIVKNLGLLKSIGTLSKASERTCKSVSPMFDWNENFFFTRRKPLAWPFRQWILEFPILW